ncbi:MULTISPECIES: four helix bundle protein [unclassified Nodularia (in: cyanobacteria)]|uniref:four helix bundle protein n=1 Tax=unclassified Nodularia (in: cyanobacteria) TaxID=2656917 RepID=UPI00187F70B4|nr:MULTISPECIES: four helix bundle protein [unclassified Nodularia (in: cyanobacteria)]MBE9200605.1 four helix bundle protein [Nodularia sp. LEGE 06071]MCC2695399.1 four helix bundle protein [Nodularia sp. LEGE 04288]
MTSYEIRSYQDLKVWQEGMNLAEACYELTMTFPKEELYGMTSQIRRASTSIPANIAEGYGREYRLEYIKFLRIAQGSLKELETHLLLSSRAKIGLTDTQSASPILRQCESVGKLLRALIRSLEKKENKE